mgnify:CR=1 FL=1
MSEFLPAKPDVEVILNARSFFLKYPTTDWLSYLVESVADEANTRKGAEVDLSVVEPVQVDLGLARFEGFERTNGQIWCGTFVLIPEEVHCPIPVAQFTVSEPQS